MPDPQEVFRRSFNNVNAQAAEKFVSALKSSPSFGFKSYLPIDDKCHFERFNFVHRDGKLGIVYDTKAEIFSVSAKKCVLGEAMRLLGVNDPVLTEAAADAVSVKPVQQQSVVVAGNNPKNAAAEKSDINGSSEAKPGKEVKELKKAKTKKPVKDKKVSVGKAATEKKADGDNTARKADGSKTAQATAKESVKKTAEKSGSKKPEAKVKSPKGESKQEAIGAAKETTANSEYKNGFSLKKCPPQRLDEFLKKIRALKGVSVACDADGEIAVYRISERGSQQKCILRYVPSKQSVQLQGKRSNLFAQVQVVLSSDSDFGEAMGSHLELTGKQQQKSSSVQKSLRKLLPDAFDLLSEQSKIDLGIGMVDIGNPDVKLSDYSVLLVPPYRGLERFIFDLQKAREISVKMIGQAYEKDDDGKHCLKAAYRKRTGIVYSEVMSALYTEYFEKRNFYAHSDNTDFGQSRMIADKDAAEKIFDDLCRIINYNAKKLKETGFTVSQ